VIETAPVILVCGSRDFRNVSLVVAVVREFDPETIVVAGGARGPDIIAAKIAWERGLHVAEVRALWERYGKRAGPLRNRAMLRLKPTHVVAFWDGSSSGTRDMISLANAADIPVSIYREDGSHELILDNWL
jgi:YspA, cpYpsA-related SLOG family